MIEINRPLNPTSFLSFILKKYSYHVKIYKEIRVNPRTHDIYIYIPRKLVFLTSLHKFLTFQFLLSFFLNYNKLLHRSIILPLENS